MKKVNVTLLVLTAIAMAVGTFLSVDGYYGAWWFVALLALDAVAAVVTIVQRKYWHSPHNLLIYASVPIMLLGGGLTMLTGEQDTLVLQPGEEQEGVTLERFEVVNYPGTQTPMDFVSQVTIDGEPYTISMNNIARHKGYRYYQEDYDGAGGSTLRVAHDPWGIGVTYAGYALLVAGLAWMFLDKRSRFRRLMKGAAVLALLFLAQTATAAPHTLGSTSGRRPSVPRDVAAKMGEQYVLYKGRVCPMQTLAKDFSTKLYGKATYQGLTAEQVLAGWMFYYGDWAEEAMPKGKNQRATEEKQALVQMVANSTLLKMFPLRDSTGVLQWYSQNDPLSLSVGEEEYIFVRKQLGYCQELVVKGDFETLAMVFDKTRQYQEKQAAGLLPSAARLKAERLYNALTTGRWLPMVLLGLGLVAFGLSMRDKGRRIQTVVHLGTPLLVAATTLYLLLVFVLRWVVGGHVPMAGGFDSMNLVTIVVGIIGLVALRRHAIAPSLSLLAMGFCQLVAMMSGANPPVTNLMPVLNSPLLTLHVAVIMMAYALFLFVALNSVAALLRPAQREKMRRTTLLLLYPAEALLAVGIIIGAVWANISWGTYWSWDPKEVWALITLIVYLYPLSATDRKPHSAAFHIYCLVALLSVAVTYFGVNLLMGGMHAYGN